MKLNRRTFAILMAGALSLCAADAFGGIPPLPPGARPPAGWAWCPRCEGRREVPSGFLGWTSKPCPNCNATGVVRVVPPPPPPPKHHHHKPAPGPQHHKPAPAMHHKPAPGPQHHKPAPGPQKHRPGQPPRP